MNSERVSIDEEDPLLPKCTSQENLDDQSRSFIQKVVRVCKGITVEPAQLMFSICFGIELVAISNLWIEKECDNLYSQKVCKNLDSKDYKTEEDAVQKIVNKYYATYSQWIEYIPSLLTVLILGAWSDFKDRKWPIVIPFVGMLLKAIGLLMNSYFWSISPVYILLASVPVGFTGGRMALAAGCSSYLGAVVTTRARTIRLALIYLIVFLGIPIGKALTAVLFRHFGYLGVFGCEIILTFLGLVYSLLFLENHPGEDESQVDSTPHTSLCSVLSLARMKQTLVAPFKERGEGKRTQILGHMVIISGLLFDLGTANFQYVYSRKKFKWDFYTFTTWSELNTPIACLGSIFLLPILSYRHGVEDSILGLMGTLSFMLNNTIIATAPEGWVMYVASVANSFAGMSFIASRGALSKLVPKEEQGTIFAVLAMSECAMPVLNGPLLTVIYNSTLDVFPGTIFAVTAVIFAFLSFIHVWLLTRPEKLAQKWMYKKSNRE